MKLFKLWVHQQTFSEDPLIVNPKEFPNERVGDILEIYHPEEENTRLLLQIKSIRHDFQQKDTISVEQSVANIFQLRTYWDVQVNKVNPKDVVVDLVELLIKDQYVSRSDMWRLSSSITDVCVYISKKIQFAGIRAQVSEIWIKDQKVSCGVISESTRVVFRSSSSLMYLFIQMSQEMWDFGLNGDLYFEKTVNCFLHELFTHWRESFTNQEVTIILFSRTFYNAQSLDEFPEEMRKSVQQNPRGQFYEDFYQVVVHGERRDDWLPVLAVLKRYFTLYPKYINCCENLDGVLLGMNSTSYAGNFLEAINLSMNIFERYHIDRTFDCTGQTVVIVTPGTGAFEVDRELSSLTKQRMIDSGVSADLVCMAEQPLHTVPLLKFFNKGEGQTSSLGDDYSIPHWINHSFYSLPNSRTAARSAYVPRIRVPDIILNYFGKDSVDIPLCEGPCYNSQNYSEHDEQPNQILDFVDYDDYDIKVFRKSSAKSRDKTRKTLLLSRKGHSSHHDVETLGQSGTFPEIVDKYEFSPEDKVGIPVPSKAVPQRQTNQHQSRLATSAETALSERVGLYGRKAASDDNVQYLNMGLEKQSAFMVGSVGTVLSHFRTDHRAPQRGLINPFKPSVIPCKWTCNRHRWSDAFPEGPGGESLFRHHTKITAADAEEGMTLKWNSVEEAGSTVVSARQNTLSDVQKSTLEEFEDRSNEEKKADSFSTLYELSPPNLKASFETIPTAIRRYNLARPSHQHINVHVEKDWAAALKTSVDWKSLVTPAILPLTTNYFPDKRTLNKSYLEYNYELWIEFDEKYGLAAERLKLSQRKESGEEDMRVGRRLLSPDQIFEELVSQRLAKGFQICRSKSSKSCDPDSRPEIRPTFSAMMARDDQSNEVLMCLGRITHKIHLSRQQSQILVTRYHPRHPLNLEAYHYVYRLGTSMQRCASVACATFSYEELYKYNWNYLDHYICGDDQDFNELLETLKYFKSRFLILPSLSTGKGSDVGQVEPRHTRNKKQREEWARVEGLMRFLEGLNRIKASSVKRRPLSPKEKRSTRTIDRKVSCVEAGSKSGSLGASKTLTQETPRSSESNSLPKEVTTTQMSVILNESKDNSESDLLSVQSSLEKIAEAMSATTNGLTFLPELKALNPVPSFLSIEAVSWMIQHVSGVSSRNEAVALGQKMLEANIIQHASGSKKQKFVDGFLIYSMLSKTPLGTESSKANSSSCKNPLEEERHQVDLLTNFRSEWFEVAVWMSKTDNSNVSFLAPNELISCFNFDGSGSLCTSGRIQTSIRRSMSISKQLGSRECDYVPAYKTVFLDADPHCKSNRPERCTVRYHGNYSPDHAFEIEVHWIAATGSIVCEMVQSWSRKASSNGFSLIPAPICPFPDVDTESIESDPLRLPKFVPLNLVSCLEKGSQNLFQGFDPSTQRMRLFLFQEAILRRFDFLRDCPYGSGTHLYHTSLPVQCSHNDYVHISGAAFVRITSKSRHEETNSDSAGFTARPKRGYRTRSCTSPRSPTADLPFSEYSSVGFLWINNFMLTKRWRTSATADSEVILKLLKEFETFCKNTKGELQQFWNSREESVKSSKKNVSDDSSVVSPIHDFPPEKEVSQQTTTESETTERCEY